MATELKGASQLRYALRKFEPDLAKELQDEMAAILKPLVKKARGFVPTTSVPSNWRGQTKTGKQHHLNQTAVALLMQLLFITRLLPALSLKRLAVRTLAVYQKHQ